MRTLKQIKANPSFLGIYMQALGMLKQSGILEHLQEIGKPRIIEMGKDINMQATQAAWSAGFNDCLELLTNFKEIHFEATKEQLQPLYGANKMALERGDLTQEEVDAINSGRNPTYNTKSASGSNAANGSATS